MYSRLKPFFLNLVSHFCQWHGNIIWWYLQAARILMKTTSQLASGKQSVGTMAYMGKVQYLMQCKCAVNSGTYLGWLMVLSPPYQVCLIFVPDLLRSLLACICDGNSPCFDDCQQPKIGDISIADLCWRFWLFCFSSSWLDVQLNGIGNTQ